MASDFTVVGNLPLPKRLVALLESGLWPRTHAEAEWQNVRSLVSADRIHLFAPDEDKIYLSAPPFHTVADEVRQQGQGKFWSKWGALKEISPDLALLIGGFELGSDSCIVLDYRQDPTNPSVMRLKWRNGQPNTWVSCAETFEEFADMIALDVRKTSSQFGVR